MCFSPRSRVRVLNGVRTGPKGLPHGRQNVVQETRSLLEQAGLVSSSAFSVPGCAALSVAQRLGTCGILSVQLSWESSSRQTFQIFWDTASELFLLNGNRPSKPYVKESCSPGTAECLPERSKP